MKKMWVMTRVETVGYYRPSLRDLKNTLQNFLRTLLLQFIRLQFNPLRIFPSATRSG